MKHETLARALTGLDDGLITDAAEAPKKRRMPRYLAAAACLLLLLGAALGYGLRAPTVLFDGSAVTASPRCVAGDTAVMSLRLHESVQVELTLRLPRETNVSVSAGTLVRESGDSMPAFTECGTVTVLWVIEDAAEDETCEMTVGDTRLLLAHDAALGGWTICKK